MQVGQNKTSRNEARVRRVGDRSRWICDIPGQMMDQM